jgi:6-pyruvoyltetrahydropterin/6-carboxytetrahydropterin synthase
MLYITRREHFNAAHRIWNDYWSDEQNEAVFGKCANKNWHGHNYELFVTVKGEPDEVTGFIINVKELSQIIRREITDQLDHKNLNMDVPFLQGIKPSTENLARVIFNRLVPHLNNCTLHCVKLQETESIYAEYFGE